MYWLPSWYLFNFLTDTPRRSDDDMQQTSFQWEHSAHFNLRNPYDFDPTGTTPFQLVHSRLSTGIWQYSFSSSPLWSFDGSLALIQIADRKETLGYDRVEKIFIERMCGLDSISHSMRTVYFWNRGYSWAFQWHDSNLQRMIVPGE